MSRIHNPSENNKQYYFTYLINFNFNEYLYENTSPNTQKFNLYGFLTYMPSCCQLLVLVSFKVMKSTLNLVKASELLLIYINIIRN